MKPAASGSWGPMSLVGVALGMFLAGTPLMLEQRADVVWLACCVAPPMVGLALLALPGMVRRFGTGLVASALTIPLFMLSWPVAAAFFA